MSEELTIREKEFIELRFDKELSIKEVADRMGICNGTARYYVGKCYRKLGIPRYSASTLITLTKRLIREGYVKP